jgi:uncharacterized SAM-binding protein YcdF (DUF218 family)
MEFGFLLKKFIGFWMLPLSLCVLLLTAGLILLWIDKHKTLGKTLCTIGLGALLLFSWNPTANFILRPIEHHIPIFDLSQPVEYVMVLGNRVNADTEMPVMNHLSSTSLKRLLEGIRILTAQPNSKLIVSGYDSDGNKSCAEAYADAAVILGIDQHRIIELPEPKDTNEEAIAAKAIVGNKTIALVTSASHMPRAFEYFKRQGIHAIPAPSNHLTPRAHNTSWRFNAEGLQKSEVAFYERLGQAWQWLSQ